MQPRSSEGVWHCKLQRKGTPKSSDANQVTRQMTAQSYVLAHQKEPRKLKWVPTIKCGGLSWWWLQNPFRMSTSSFPGFWGAHPPWHPSPLSAWQCCVSSVHSIQKWKLMQPAEPTLTALPKWLEFLCCFTTEDLQVAREFFHLTLPVYWPFATA